MHITKLNIKNLRIISNLKLQPNKTINIIQGKNGAGKSSILEAIYILVRNKSFRLTNINNLIKIKENEINVSASIKYDDGHSDHIELIKSPTVNRLIVNGRRKSKLTTVAFSIPVGTITPKVHKLIEEGPIIRRRLIDWGVFHVEHEYAKSIMKYRNVLQQRNALLNSDLESINIWSEQLDYYAEYISSKRVKYLDKTNKILKIFLKDFFPHYHFDFVFKKGWDDKSNLADILKKNISSDIKRGYTFYGAHRADLTFKVDGRLAKDILSRGELKILGILCILSFLKTIKTKNNDSPILIVDDIFSELDSRNLRLLMNIIQQEKYQTFLSVLDKKIMNSNIHESKLFHVEHGELV